MCTKYSPFKTFLLLLTLQYFGFGTPVHSQVQGGAPEGFSLSGSLAATWTNSTDRLQSEEPAYVMLESEIHLAYVMPGNQYGGWLDTTSLVENGKLEANLNNFGIQVWQDNWDLSIGNLAIRRGHFLESISNAVNPQIRTISVFETDETIPIPGVLANINLDSEITLSISYMVGHKDFEFPEHNGASTLVIQPVHIVNDNMMGEYDSISAELQYENDFDVTIGVHHGLSRVPVLTATADPTLPLGFQIAANYLDQTQLSAEFEGLAGDVLLWGEGYYNFSDALADGTEQDVYGITVGGELQLFDVFDAGNTTLDIGYSRDSAMEDSAHLFGNAYFLDAALQGDGISFWEANFRYAFDFEHEISRYELSLVTDLGIHTGIQVDLGLSHLETSDATSMMGQLLTSGTQLSSTATLKF